MRQKKDIWVYKTQGHELNKDNSSTLDWIKRNEYTKLDESNDYTEMNKKICVHIIK